MHKTDKLKMFLKEIESYSDYMDMATMYQAKDPGKTQQLKSMANIKKTHANEVMNMFPEIKTELHDYVEELESNLKMLDNLKTYV